MYNVPIVQIREVGRMLINDGEVGISQVVKFLDFFYPISLLPVADYGVGWSLILVTTALLLAASAGRENVQNRD